MRELLRVIVLLGCAGWFVSILYRLFMVGAFMHASGASVGTLLVLAGTGLLYVLPAILVGVVVWRVKL